MNIILKLMSIFMIIWSISLVSDENTQNEMKIEEGRISPGYYFARHASFIAFYFENYHLTSLEYVDFQTNEGMKWQVIQEEKESEDEFGWYSYILELQSIETGEVYSFRSQQFNDQLRVKVSNVSVIKSSWGFIVSPGQPNGIDFPPADVYSYPARYKIQLTFEDGSYLVYTAQGDKTLYNVGDTYNNSPKIEDFIHPINPGDEIFFSSRRDLRGYTHTIQTADGLQVIGLYKKD